MGDTTEDVRIDAAKAAETSVSKAEYRISQKSESEPIVKSDLKEGSAVRKSRTERGKADTGDDDSSRGEESVSQGRSVIRRRSMSMSMRRRKRRTWGTKRRRRAM